MEIKLINNEKINNSNRAKEIHFIEIMVDKIENIDEELAEKFLRDILKQNIHLDFTQETWNDIKEIIIDKLNKNNKYPKGYLKNDGMIIPLIANYIIEKIFNVELLSYSENIDDIEIVPKGFDALFLDSDLSIFLCEHKTSIAKLSEEGISNKFIEGYKSIFCTDSSIISKISTIKSRIDNESKRNKEIIKSNLNELIHNRKNLVDIIDKECAKFNICCVTKNANKLILDTIVSNINKKFTKEEYCKKNRKICYKAEECKRIEKIKVVNIIVITIPEDFEIVNFYENIVNKIEEKINER